MNTHKQNLNQTRSSKSLVQERFGRQAKAYATSSILSDKGNLDTIIELAEILKGDIILDVATGTGFMAAAFSEVAGQVIATDLTAPMLEQARIKTGGRENVWFALADAEHLPFSSTSFDVVSCRIAFHHFSYPAAALAEMERVCKPNGRVIIMDITASEDKAMSEYQNRVEKLRDPSHVRHYSQLELMEMLKTCGLEIEKIEPWSFTWSFEEWIRIAGPDAVAAQKIKRLMLDSIEGDKAGLRVELRKGELFFTYNTAIIVARK